MLVSTGSYLLVASLHGAVLTYATQGGFTGAVGRCLEQMWRAGTSERSLLLDENGLMRPLGSPDFTLLYSFEERWCMLNHKAGVVKKMMQRPGSQWCCRAPMGKRLLLVDEPLNLAFCCKPNFSCAFPNVTTLKHIFSDCLLFLYSLTCNFLQETYDLHV